MGADFLCYTYKISSIISIFIGFHNGFGDIVKDISGFKCVCNNTLSKSEFSAIDRLQLMKSNTNTNTNTIRVCQSKFFPNQNCKCS